MREVESGSLAVTLQVGEYAYGQIETIEEGEGKFGHTMQALLTTPSNPKGMWVRISQSLQPKIRKGDTIVLVRPETMKYKVLLMETADEVKRLFEIGPEKGFDLKARQAVPF